MADVPDDDGWLSPREAAWVARMRFPKRRTEFRLGRWTAKQTLALALDRPRAPFDLRTIEIDRAPDGAPAPLIDGRAAAASISMTDRADHAVCVVGPPGAGVGCGLELVEPRSAAFVADYLTPPEQALVAGVAEDERARVANLIWCGKESALKVLRTGLRRDTRSVEVSLPDAPPADGWAPLAVQSVEGDTYTGWWRRYGSFLLTVVADTSFAPPQPLEEPPPLARATPAHGWLGTREGPTRA